MHQSAKLALKLLNILLTIGVLYFAYEYGQRVIGNVDVGELQIHVTGVLAAFAMFALFYGVLSLHWLSVCRQIDQNASRRQTLAFIASQPYKYLPTSLFTFSFRAKYAKAEGLSIKKSSQAQLIENINLITSGLAVSAILYLAVLGRMYFILPIFLLVLLGYIAVPQNITLSIKNFSWEFNKKYFLQSFSIAASAWIVAGMSLFVLSNALGITVSPIAVIAANAAAYSIGIVSFFAPGGIGVREAIFALFSVSGVLIAAWRVLTFVVDLVLGFAAVCVIKFHLPKHNQ